MSHYLHMIAQLTMGRSGGAVAETDHSDYACDILMSTNMEPSYRARGISERPMVLQEGNRMVVTTFVRT